MVIYHFMKHHVGVKLKPSDSYCRKVQILTKWTMWTMWVKSHFMRNNKLICNIKIRVVNVMPL